MGFLSNLFRPTSDFTYILWEGMTLGQFQYRNKKNLDFGSSAYINLEVIEPEYHKKEPEPTYYRKYDLGLTGSRLERAKNIDVPDPSNHYLTHLYEEQINELRFEEYSSYLVAQVKVYLYGAISSGGFLQEPSDPKVEITLVEKKYEKTYDRFFINKVMIFTQEGKDFTYKTVDGTSSDSPVYECRTNLEYPPFHSLPPKSGSPTTNNTPATNINSSISKKNASTYYKAKVDGEKIYYGEFRPFGTLKEGVFFDSHSDDRLKVGLFNRSNELENGYNLGGMFEIRSQVSNGFENKDFDIKKGVDFLLYNRFLPHFIEDYDLSWEEIKDKIKKSNPIEENHRIYQNTGTQTTRGGVRTQIDDYLEQYGAQMCFTYGLDLHKKKEYLEALKYFIAAAQGDCSKGYFYIGLYYHNGLAGLPVDYETALRYYRTAARDGDAYAMNNIGVIYERVKKDFKEALVWYKKGKDRGLKTAEDNYNSLYKKMYPNVVNTTAQNYTNRPVSSVDDKSKYINTTVHLDSQGKPIGNRMNKSQVSQNINDKQGDKENADKWFKQGKAFYNLRMDEYYKTAFGLFKKAAELGHVEANDYLGVMYYYGYGIAKDYALAVKYLGYAADRGLAKAQCSLGYMYENGYGVSKNINRAIELYKKSALQGNMDAQYNLGQCYYFGEGVHVDYQKARDLFEKAAAQGEKDSMLYLGDMYYFGLGVKEDSDMAEKWYRKGAEAGNEEAAAKLNEFYRS